MSTRSAPAIHRLDNPPRASEHADLFAPATVVLFAGCGGTCIGIEQAYVDGGFKDKYVDLAINHWDTAVGVHELNHPMTQHLRGDVREIDPNSVLKGRPIGYLHASPDCTHFSKARGSKPKRKEIRGLAWVVVDWARKRRPDVITLENVEEFRSWGPLAKDGQPCPRRSGQTYRQWVKALRGLGYQVEDRELRACDYGAPTTRKRLFVVARCDGKENIWPEKTHRNVLGLSGRVHRRVGDRESLCRETHSRQPEGETPGVQGDSRRVFQTGQRREKSAGGIDDRRGLKPYRTAAECIDWSIPMLSIFATPAEASAWAARVNEGRAKHERIGVPRRPLKAKTLQRIARGLVKWVIEAKRPYIVQLAHGGDGTWGDARSTSPDQPVGTIHAGGNNHAVVDAVVAPFTAEIGNTGGNGAYTRPADAPTSTQTSKAKELLVAASLTRMNHTDGGRSPVDPLRTIVGAEHHGVVNATLAPYTVPNLGEREGQAPRSASVEQPMPTVTSTSKGNGARLVAATIAPFTQTLNHGGEEHRAADLREPIATITGANDARALVAALITKHYGGVVGHGVKQPIGSVTATDHHAITCAYLSHFYTSNTAGGHGDPNHPAKCITSGGQHAAVTVAMLREDSHGTDHPELNRSDSLATERPVSDVRGNEDAAHDDVPAGLRETGPGNEARAVSAGGRGVRGGDRRGDEGAGREDAAPAEKPVAPFLIGAGGPAYAAKPKSLEEPANTVMVDDRRALVAAFLDTYYGNSKDGGRVDAPAPTVVSKDRISLVTVVIDGTTYVITDIAMRMLTPRELMLAQGFPPDYRVDMTADGTRVSKADQVKLIGNAVPPPFARALAFDNVVKQGVLGAPPRRKAVRS